MGKIIKISDLTPDDKNFNKGSDALMLKPTLQRRVDEIIKRLELGEGRGSIVSKFAKKYQVTERTVDRWLKSANEQYKKKQEKAKAAADKAYIETVAKAAESLVMSVIERQELLTRIAKGEVEEEYKRPAWNHDKKVFEIIKVIQHPSINDKIKAVAELNKMDGSYAPAKIAQTDSEGNDIVWNETKVYEANKKADPGA